MPYRVCEPLKRVARRCFILVHLRSIIKNAPPRKPDRPRRYSPSHTIRSHHYTLRNRGILLEIFLERLPKTMILIPEFGVRIFVSTISTGKDLQSNSSSSNNNNKYIFFDVYTKVYYYKIFYNIFKRNSL